MKHKEHGIPKVERSAVYTFIGIVILFSSAVIVTLFAPNFMDSSWIEPTSPYQVQMYEVSDPNTYLSRFGSESTEIQAVYHLQKGISLLAFNESETTRIIAKGPLEKYITRFGDPEMKLTSRLLMLRKPSSNPREEVEKFQEQWRQNHPDWESQGLIPPGYNILELYEPETEDAFALAATESITENWVDENYVILDEEEGQKWHSDPGVIYINNPVEYRIREYAISERNLWQYDPEGRPIASLQELKSAPFKFLSRKELIRMGERIYAAEGCWYCHTDQTRTLVQDVVLNGSESYPAPPSSANEFIYDQVTFPGTRRIGVDLSRVGAKKPGRDWHISHFWSPQTASKGSIMPAFHHFFDDDPRGKAAIREGVPNLQFEAVYQYLMTKGTRITSPNQAWWIGKDPVQTKKIIEGKK
ncbi:MAG: cbb3-type cytochrome c oxidase subunit II [Waddliaceae bacterium]